MSEPKPPIEQLLDAIVYGPVGALLAVRENMPTLAEKGRTQVTGQLALARMIGQFAVDQGQREAQKLTGRLVRQAVELLGAGGGDGAAAPGATAPARSPQAGVPDDERGHTAGDGPVTAPPSHTNGAAGATVAAGAPAPTDDHLAIPGYDTLSASQVVQRLAGLSGTELDAVGAYEQSTRRRRTILSKVAQLQSEGPA